MRPKRQKSHWSRMVLSSFNSDLFGLVEVQMYNFFLSQKLTLSILVPFGTILLTSLVSAGLNRIGLVSTSFVKWLNFGLSWEPRLSFKKRNICFKCKTSVWSCLEAKLRPKMGLDAPAQSKHDFNKTPEEWFCHRSKFKSKKGKIFSFLLACERDLSASIIHEPRVERSERSFANSSRLNIS